MFIDTNLETLIPFFNKLKAETVPLWGSMSAQRMVEHLTDTLRIATGENPQKMEIPEEKIDRMVAFLDSEKPMARNMVVPFAPADAPLRHQEIELAIDEYIETWLDLEALYSINPDLRNPHPYYGPLSYEQWKRLNAKHLTHHFIQFGLIEDK